MDSFLQYPLALLALAEFCVISALFRDNEKSRRHCNQLKQENRKRKKQYNSKINFFVSRIKELRVKIHRLEQAQLKATKAAQATPPAPEPENITEADKWNNSAEGKAAQAAEKWHQWEKKLTGEVGEEEAQKVSLEARRRLDQEKQNGDLY